MGKDKFPRRLLVVRTTDTSDDPILICYETPEEIPEDFADEPIGVYELVTTGKLNVEKSVDGEPPKTITERILDNATHEEMTAYVRKIGLKLYTKNMSTKQLRKTLREYLFRKK